MRVLKVSSAGEDGQALKIRRTHDAVDGDRDKMR
jgi:hypothetical protein